MSGMTAIAGFSRPHDEVHGKVANTNAAANPAELRTNAVIRLLVARPGRNGSRA
jgi:hypothetical protein